MATAFYTRSATFVQGSTTLPSKYFTSPEIFALELDHIFYRRWLCAGRVSQISHPGDYFLAEIGNENLIVTRDKQNRLHVFYNVCRHRGTRLCEETSGRFSGSIQCPYHAWTYALDGRLIGAPLMQDTEGFDRQYFPLHSAAVAEWEGFIFINLSPDPEPLHSYLSPLIGRFSRFKLAQLQSAGRIEYQVNANWKLIFQNYSECLHCPTLHPGLARLSPFQSGENDLFEGPFLGGYMEIVEDAGSLTMSGRVCGLPIGDLPAEDQKRVYYYSIYPNMLLSLHPDYVMVHTIWPRSPSKTTISCEWFFHPASFQQSGFDPNEAINFWDLTNRQDWHICEMSQAGVSSRAYQPGPYSSRESISAAWDREYLRSLK
ncbi:MAG: aromatic ring-hydroxylating dioxygenase subunit alpha [Anaerolineales bacterium]|nr:aromatic ring-hydroxylating dioxygenase subunit alpha [Anaerolineales bacterium]